MTVTGARVRAPRERKAIPFAMKLVEVIDDEEAAKLISDPMRRAILNLLRRRAMTEAELAASLGLTDGTVNYHLRLLRKIGFVVVAHTEAEEHGILQKFYAPTAFLYIPDVEKLPKEVARYYYPLNMERMRGVLSGWAGSSAHLSDDLDVDQAGEDLARELVRAARERLGLETGPDGGEQMVNEIYTDALARLAQGRPRTSPG